MKHKDRINGGEEADIIGIFRKRYSLALIAYFCSYFLYCLTREFSLKISQQGSVRIFFWAIVAALAAVATAGLYFFLALWTPNLDL